MITTYMVALCAFMACKKNQNYTESLKNDNTNVIAKTNFNLDKAIKDCETQLNIAVPRLTDLTKHPRFIEARDTTWVQVPNDELIWTSGLYPDILWYMYDITSDEKWKKEAIKRTEVFEDFKNITEYHDIGFMMFPANTLIYDFLF